MRSEGKAGAGTADAKRGGPGAAPAPSGLRSGEDREERAIFTATREDGAPKAPRQASGASQANSVPDGDGGVSGGVAGARVLAEDAAGAELAFDPHLEPRVAPHVAGLVD